SLRRRGSVYRFGETKVLAMLDPVLTYGRGKLTHTYEKAARLDWERAKELIKPHTTHHQYCGCAHRITRTHHSEFTDPAAFLQELDRFDAYAQDEDTVMAIDIETPKVRGKRQVV